MNDVAASSNEDSMILHRKLCISAEKIVANYGGIRPHEEGERCMNINDSRNMNLHGHLQGLQHYVPVTKRANTITARPADSGVLLASKSTVVLCIGSDTAGGGTRESPILGGW